MIPDMYTAAVLLKAKLASSHPNIVHQHVPPLRAQLFRPQASERRDRTQMPSVLGESRESCRLNNTQPHSNKPQCYIEEYITSYLAKAPRSPTTRSMAHIHRIFPPRRRSEGSWLRPRREWACTRSLLRSVYAASVLVCRVKPRRCAIPSTTAVVLCYLLLLDYK